MERPSFEAEAVEAILEAMLTPPGAYKIEKTARTWGPTSKPFLRRVLKPSSWSLQGGFWPRFWEPFGLDFRAPGASCYFLRKWHLATARARFLGVPEVQK